MRTRRGKGLQTVVQDFAPPPSGYVGFLLQQFHWLTKFHLDCLHDATIVDDIMGRVISQESGTPVEEPDPSDPHYCDKLNQLAHKLASGEIWSDYDPGSMYDSVVAEMWQLPTIGERLRTDTNIEHLAAISKLSEFYAACPFKDERTFRGIVHLARMSNTVIRVSLAGGLEWNTAKVANELHDAFPGIARASKVAPFRVSDSDAREMALKILGHTPGSKEQLEVLKLIYQETTWEDSHAEDLMLKGINVELKERGLRIARGKHGNVVREPSRPPIGTAGKRERPKPTLGQLEDDTGEVGEN